LRQFWDVLPALTRLTRLEYDTAAFADLDDTWLAKVLPRC
jgi:hypothetical protein